MIMSSDDMTGRPDKEYVSMRRRVLADSAFYASRGSCETVLRRQTVSAQCVRLSVNDRPMRRCRCSSRMRGNTAEKRSRHTGRRCPSAFFVSFVIIFFLGRPSASVQHPTQTLPQSNPTRTSRICFFVIAHSRWVFF